MILYSCIRTSENITGWPTEGKCTFFSIGIPCRALQSWMKISFKGINLSIKKLPGTFKGQFPLTEVARRKQRKGSILCAKKKNQRSSVKYILQLPLHFICWGRPNLLTFLAFQHGRPTQPLHLYACKVDDNGALAVVHRAQQVTCRPIVHL